MRVGGERAPTHEPDHRHRRLLRPRRKRPGDRCRESRRTRASSSDDPKPKTNAEYSRSKPCIAAKAGRSCPVGVIRVGSKQAAASPDVRFTSDSDHTGASQRSDALCHKRTYAPQQKSRYSITSSVRACNVAGTSMSSAWAVLRLSTISNAVGCSTGRSAGLEPLSIRPA
jgi:hypothetical protein